ncbi:MAG: DUF975 family protein [Bacteroidales bacterium]|nr:DUF975 family protein [Bacteroidales bacterium]
MKTNQQFKNEALAALRGNWGKAVLITLLYLIITCIASAPSTYASWQADSYVQQHVGQYHNPFQLASKSLGPEIMQAYRNTQKSNALSFFLDVLLVFPLMLGYANTMRKLLVDGDNNLTVNTFRIAFSKYWRKVWGMLWMNILIFLWSLLFFIPGIIKSFSYAMTPFILEENPEMGAVEAIHRSRMMMRGHKFDLFWLELSFIGWIILGILTAGIGLLWIIPYMQTAIAAFYEEVKADYALNGGLD